MDRTMQLFAGVSYFHGRLSPDQANFRLIRRGKQDGLYLIYEDMETTGRFVLAICSEDRIRTYHLVISPDGQVTYGNGVMVPLVHPHDLIHYHLQKCPSFHTRPLVPCLRPNENDDEPMAWTEITMEDLERRMILEGQNPTISAADILEGPDRPAFLQAVGKQLHRDQLWYHGPISRSEAEERLCEAGQGPSGTFLIRDKESGAFVLSMCYRDGFRHYTIHCDVTDDGEMLHMDEEPAFYNLMDIVEHYRNKPKTFVLRLATPCVASGFKKKDLPTLAEKAMKDLSEYKASIQHLQHPDENASAKTNARQTDQVLATTIGDSYSPPKLHAPVILKQENSTTDENKSDESQKGDVCTRDAEDLMLEEIISAVTCFNNDLLVTKIEI